MINNMMIYILFLCCWSDDVIPISVPPAGILYGTMTLELGGKVTIECEKTKCFTELEFKLKVFSFIFTSVLFVNVLWLVYLTLYEWPQLTLCSLQPFLGGACSVNQISGKISVGEEQLATVDGHWVRVFISLSALCPCLSLSEVHASASLSANYSLPLGIQCLSVVIRGLRAAGRQSKWMT